MYTHKRSTTGLLAAAALFGATALTGAQAANVTYSDIDDAFNVPEVPFEMFDVGATAVDGGNANRLNLGLTDFKADSTTSLFSFDTMSLLITAPVNYVITKLTYKETASFSLENQSFVAATGSIAAGGQTKNLGLNSASIASEGADSAGDWNLGATFDFAVGDGVSELLVTVSNSLVAIATGATGDASVTKTSAYVEAELSFVPIPPAVFLLGSALMGLVVVGRRRETA